MHTLKWSVRASALGFASASAIAVGSVPAIAQETAVDESRDEVIVSARRRDESLKDVPIAVSVFDGQRLEEIGALDLTDIEAVTPNVTLEVSRGTNSTLSAFIRGVGQQDPVAGFEAGVGLYVDDVYLNRPQAAVLDIYDVERIEVLRGPQGTLYGRNTIGGAVKYVTRRLSDDPSASLRLTGGTFGQFDAVGTFSLPVLDDSFIGDLKVGGGVAYLTRNGFGDNLNLTGLENYNKDVLAFRGSIEWDPSDNLSVRFAGDWTEDDSDPRQGHRLLPFTGFPVLENVFDTRSGLNTPEQGVEARGLSNTIEFRATDTLTFKNIVAYRDSDTTTPIDFDSLPVIDLDVATEYRDHQFSEEFQALYEGERLSGVLGFYYLSANARNDFDVLLGGGGTNVFTSSDVDTRTWSIFGDFSFDVTDRLAVSVGGRYTQDERSIFLRRQIFLNGGPGFPLGTLSPSLGGPLRPPLITQTNLLADADFEDFSPRASISYAFSDEHTGYVSYAKGFKGGSFDPRCVAVTAPDIDGDLVPGALDPDDQRSFCLFQPEEIDTFEVGLKSQFGDVATSNFAVFYSDYQDVQIPGSFGVDTNGDGIADTFAGVTTNAAAATLWGIEWEGDVRLAQDWLSAGDALNVQFALGYISAEFDEYAGRGSPPPDLTNVAVFQNTPKITSFAQLNYARPLSLFGNDGGLNLYTSFSFRSLTNQFNFRSPIDQPAYALLNAGFTWTTDNGRWSAGVHGTNLTDKEYIVAGYDFVTALPQFGNAPLGATGVQTAFFGNPRQVFGTIKVAF
ncbi:MAG: TonB-dependent receptor [Parvularculaceae bacterium]|nr:TonB-dependent receptor [Parvularculaceae bacterium]